MKTKATPIARVPTSARTRWLRRAAKMLGAVFNFLGELVTQDQARQPGAGHAGPADVGRRRGQGCVSRTVQ